MIRDLLTGICTATIVGAFGLMWFYTHLHGYVVENQEIYWKSAQPNMQFEIVRLAGADSQTFAVIPKGLGKFAKDHRAVYFRGVKIPGADPSSFRIVNAIQGIGRDRYHTYAGIEMMPGPDQRS